MLTEILVSLFAIDSLRLWRRATIYPRLFSRGRVIDAPALISDYQLIAAPGVEVPQEVIWRAVQWADDEGVLVVDLMPHNLSVGRVLAQLSLVHPINYAQRPFLPGVSAGAAVLIHESVLSIAPLPEEAQRSLPAWIEYAKSLKRFAPWESALLAVEAWSLSDQERRILEGGDNTPREVGHALFGHLFEQSRWATPVLFVLFTWLIMTEGVYGALALVAWCLQPLLILGRERLTRRSALQYALLRPLYDLVEWARKLGPISKSPSDEELIEIRAAYQEELSSGLDRLFQEPLTACPLCDKQTLVEHFSVPDLYQQKPGVFRLDRCESCDHIFQNPQLTVEGLSFYYRDFYDGLGERGMDLVFGASEVSYRQRVSMIRAHGAPRSWLDVGGGHGHFALIAKHLLPQTSFDVLDLSESVEIAAQRRWCDHGIRGLFPEMSTELKGKYDGISMSHYLEHTMDPVAELDTVAEILEPGGLVMIEIPDPDSVIGRALGWLWLPWFQPQHLHLLSARNLVKLLEERGFEIAEIDRHEAHQSVDFFFAALLLIQRIAPDPHPPWRDLTRGQVALASLWRLIISLLGLPLIILGVVLDKVMRPVLTRPRLSNTQRILAVKSGGASESDQITS